VPINVWLFFFSKSHLAFKGLGHCYQFWPQSSEYLQGHPRFLSPCGLQCFSSLGNLALCILSTCSVHLFLYFEILPNVGPVFRSFSMSSFCRPSVLLRSLVNYISAAVILISFAFFVQFLSLISVSKASILQ